MEYKIHDCKSYRIHTIKTDKFKNCSMEIMFRNKLEKDKITANNMLVDMLMHSSKKYPKRRDVAIELENLYSASFRGFTTRLGSSVMLSFVLDFLNPKYCEKGYAFSTMIGYSFGYCYKYDSNMTEEECDNADGMYSDYSNYGWSCKLTKDPKRTKEVIEWEKNHEKLIKKQSMFLIK